MVDRPQADGSSIWWRCIWVLCILLFLGVTSIYICLPLDGASGDSGSFTPDGFRIKWLIEERPGGLRVGDVITRMDGHTIEEWLRGAPNGLEWRANGIVTYEVLRGTCSSGRYVQDQAEY